jgi:hypothetical protein
VIDRLLASPHYGERWGRHWLDLVRYAETNGHEFDNDKLDAWQYRDYIIRAFNQDVPYDTFVREHIAGDLMKTPRLSEDGTLIELNSRGYRHGNAETLQRLVSGEDVDPSEYYMYATPHFDVPPGPHAWLGKSVFLVTGHRLAHSSTFRYWMAV